MAINFSFFRASGEILRNVIFTISGFNAPERTELRDMGVSLGARYEPTLTDECTHIITKFDSTSKIKTASQKGVKVVDEGWLKACKNRRKRVSEDNYR